MAPRRKSGSKAAAAAAAARRQFKVGDLVLAKVKGFPAWPATVSEPEKWGYAPDWKKVHVFFFGTQQIAFCNPADVEPFTEEKKEHLLSKRHGKGSDFVRAVQEIIESYEKLKKQEHSSEEVTLTNSENPAELSAKYESNHRTGTPPSTPDSRLKPSNSAVDGNESSVLYMDAAAVNSLHDEGASGDGPSDSVIAKNMPSIATYSSRKRSSGSRSKRPITQDMVTSINSSRSSSRLESRKSQNMVKPTSNSGSSTDILGNVGHDGSRRRSNRIRKPIVFSQGDDVQSISNASTEDNGSEIATIDSDSCSLNEGNVMDSGCKPEQPDTAIEYPGDVELSKGLDLQIHVGVRKKKRKPSRRKAINSTAELTVQVGKEENVDIKVAPSSCVEQEARDSKEDGDEHLPLSKRARVRMGKQFSIEELQGSIQAEEKVEEAKLNLGQQNPELHSNGDCPADGITPAIERASDDSQKESAELLNNTAHFWQVKNNQPLGCSLDGEATLPPSKRLHRALEAMSANAAEEDCVCTEASSTLPMMANGSCIMPMQESPNRAIKREEGNDCGIKTENPPSNNASEDAVTENRTSASCIVSKELDIGSQLVNGSCSQDNEVHEDQPQEVTDHVEQRELSVLSPGTCNVQAAAHRSGKVSPYFDHEVAHHTDQVSPDKRQLSKDEGDTDDILLRESGCNDVNKGPSLSEQSGLCSDYVSVVDKTTEDLPQGGTTVSCSKAGAAQCEKSDSLKSQVDENSQVNSMCDSVEETKDYGKQKYASSTHLSDHQLEVKGAKGVHLLSPPTGGVISPAHNSPPNASVYHISTSESVAGEEGKVEPVVTQRSKSLGKSGNYLEVQAAVSSFDTMLGTLTRTKESIGRATRIAIDCAKFGTAAKVVEILMCHLESEPSLHRKVDLFFLVDSILKGDSGVVYPSAVQAVLPRLLSAAAPPGSAAQENRRQCLKVLRLWLERKILPESVIRHHMRELDSVCGLPNVYSRRTLRTERALDDPVREMGSMLVDEYGSNSSFQLPGFCMPCMLKDDDDGSDSDGGSFEAVTPEHESVTPEERDRMPLAEKRGHILEDVDGELEMEDVAPCEAELNSSNDAARTNIVQNLENQREQHFPHPFSQPPPLEVASSSPPPLSMPSQPPAPPLQTPVSAMGDHYPDGVNSKLSAPNHNVVCNSRQSMTTAATRSNHSFSNSGHYHGPEYREHQMRMEPPESSTSFGSFHAQPANNLERGSNFHNKAQPPRPPHPVPSGQFSYVHGDQHVKSRRDAPRHCYSNRFHNGHMNRGNYYNNHERIKPGPYNNHERIKPGPYENRGGWRCPAPNFPGPRYHDRKATYAPDPYMDPPREPTRIMNEGWNMPPRPWNHRNSAPFRPPPEGSFPVSSRAPNFWRPR